MARKKLRNGEAVSDGPATERVSGSGSQLPESPEPELVQVSIASAIRPGSGAILVAPASGRR